MLSLCIVSRTLSLKKTSLRVVVGGFQHLSDPKSCKSAVAGSLLIAIVSRSVKMLLGHSQST